MPKYQPSKIFYCQFYKQVHTPHPTPPFYKMQICLAKVPYLNAFAQILNMPLGWCGGSLFCEAKSALVSHLSILNIQIRKAEWNILSLTLTPPFTNCTFIP